MNIQLVPGTLNDANVKNRLRQTIKVAEALRGCVAYWVIKPDYLGPTFHSLLGKETSFYCIDIHKPTDLNSINDHYHLGATNLFLHLRKAKKSKDHPLLPKNLLHAKIMLFDLPDQKAEIWIGSHNLTNRALNGGNIEASTVINCNIDSQFYQQVNDYLYVIKNKCEAYDPSLLQIYQSIQNDKTEADQESELIYTIPFIGNDINELPGQTIMLLGENAADLQSLGLGRVNQDVYIGAVDIKSNEEVDFKATVINSGRIINAEPKSYNMSFSNRLYAIRRGPFFPYLSRRSKELTAYDLIKFSYYANIVVEAPLKGYELKPVSSQGNKLWHWEKEEPVGRKTHGSSRNWWELPEETEEEIVVYRAVIHSQTKSDNTIYPLMEIGYSLKAALNRPEREQILLFFKQHFELPFFNSEQIGRYPELKLPEKGSFEFDYLLKDFRRDRLGKKMRLVKVKNRS